MAAPFTADPAASSSVVVELDTLLHRARARGAALTCAEGRWWDQTIRRAKAFLSCAETPPAEVEAAATEALRNLRWADEGEAFRSAGG